MALDGSASTTTITPRGIDADHDYRVRLLGGFTDPTEIPMLGGKDEAVVPGARLLAGIELEQRSTRSWMLAIEECR